MRLWDEQVEEMGRASAWRARVDLARVPPFRLAGLTVDPAQRRVAAPDGAEETIEPRVMQVLVALVRAAGEVMSRDDLVAACWGGTHVGDDAVSRVVVKARRLGEGIGGGGFTVETLPRVGYRLVAEQNGDAARATPAIAAPASSPAPIPSTPGRPRRRAIAAGILLICLIGLAAGWWLWRPAPPPAPTVAIARFATSGLPPSAAALLDAELRTALDTSDVAVRSRDAPYLVSGSAQRLDDIVRYNATLDDSRTGETIATISRDMPATTPVGGFAKRLGGTLACVVQGIAQHPEILPIETARLWGQYCEARGQGPEASGRMLDLARRLRRAAPDFHGGWYGTAYAIAVMQMAEPGSASPALRAEALAAAARFTDLAPDNPRAWETLAGAIPPAEATRREAMLRKAIAIGPERCGCAYQELGDFLLQSGRIAEAGRMYRRGTDQDRNGVLAQWRRVMHAYLAGDTDGGDALMRRIEQLNPGNKNPRQTAFERARWTSRWTAAADAVPLTDPAAHAALRKAMLALGSGDRSRIAQAGQAIERLPMPPVSELEFVPVLALLGRNDVAFALLERSRNGLMNYAAPGRHPGYSRPMLFDPSLRPLFDDPRMAGFLQRAGFIAYWRASRSRPDMCSSAKAPAFCRLIE